MTTYLQRLASKRNWDIGRIRAAVATLRQFSDKRLELMEMGVDAEKVIKRQYETEKAQYLHKNPRK